MRRLHATLLIIKIAACFALLIACEVWRAGRREWTHKRILR